MHLLELVIQDLRSSIEEFEAAALVNLQKSVDLLDLDKALR